MDEVDAFLGEDFFEGGEDDNEPGVSNQDAVPSDAELINNAYKKDEKTKTPRTMRPQPKLRELELCGPKGIDTLEEVFSNCKFDSKQNPYKNLAVMMNRLEYWAHLLHPSINFSDFIGRVEALGEKRMVQAHMARLRLGVPQFDADDNADRMEDDAFDNTGTAAEESKKDSPQPGDVDDIDDFINQFYENPDSAIISGDQGRSSQQENKHPDLEEVRQKRNAFFERNESSVLHDAAQRDSSMQEASADSGSSTSKQNAEESVLMDDLSALDLIYSTE